VITAEIRVDFNKLNSSGAKLKAGLTAAVAKTTFDIQRAAQGFARVDTGAMRAGIVGKPAGLQGEVVSGPHYTIYNEFGTYKMSAQPMFRPAADQGMPGFIAACTAAVSGIA
jgi:HK97 gp10 family phage protein